jgi:hypothetical protein
MKKIAATALAFLLILTALSSFAETLPEFHKEPRVDFETIIANEIAGTEYVKQHYTLEEGCVAIPTVVAYKTLMNGPKTLVYGYFSVDIFRLEDEQLEGVDGAGYFGVITLEKTGADWKITTEEYIQDDNHFKAEVERIAEGDKELLRQYMDEYKSYTLISSAFYSNVCDYLDQNHMRETVYSVRFPGSEHPISLYPGN